MRSALFALAVILTAHAVSAQTLRVAESEEGYLNLRAGPATTHDVLRRLSPGDGVRVIEEVGRWARVRLPDGTVGWASLTYLKRGDPAVAPPRFVAGGIAWLNLRDGPGTGHSVLRRLYSGDRLEPLGRRGDWMRVRHVSGAEGWAHVDYLTE
jgi:N-acetylmuramoyl-L-alanine amidase